MLPSIVDSFSSVTHSSYPGKQTIIVEVTSLSPYVIEHLRKHATSVNSKSKFM